jgi:hypothetical protein
MFGQAGNPETDAQLKLLAYYAWQAEGCPVGRALDHWERARVKLHGTQQTVVSHYEGGISAQPPSTTSDAAY